MSINKYHYQKQQNLSHHQLNNIDNVYHEKPKKVESSNKSTYNHHGRNKSKSFQTNNSSLTTTNYSRHPCYSKVQPPVVKDEQKFSIGFNNVDGSHSNCNIYSSYGIKGNRFSDLTEHHDDNNNNQIFSLLETSSSSDSNMDSPMVATTAALLAATDSPFFKLHSLLWSLSRIFLLPNTCFGATTEGSDSDNINMINTNINNNNNNNHGNNIGIEVWKRLLHLFQDKINTFQASNKLINNEVDFVNFQIPFFLDGKIGDSKNSNKPMFLPLLCDALLISCKLVMDPEKTGSSAAAATSMLHKILTQLYNLLYPINLFALLSDPETDGNLLSHSSTLQLSKLKPLKNSTVISDNDNTMAYLIPLLYTLCAAAHQIQQYQRDNYQGSNNNNTTTSFLFQRQTYFQNLNQHQNQKSKMEAQSESLEKLKKFQCLLTSLSFLVFFWIPNYDILYNTKNGVVTTTTTTVVDINVDNNNNTQNSVTKREKLGLSSTPVPISSQLSQTGLLNSVVSPNSKILEPAFVSEKVRFLINLYIPDPESFSPLDHLIRLAWVAVLYSKLCHSTSSRFNHGSRCSSSSSMQSNNYPETGKSTSDHNNNNNNKQNKDNNNNIIAKFIEKQFKKIFYEQEYKILVAEDAQTKSPPPPTRESNTMTTSTATGTTTVGPVSAIGMPNTSSVFTAPQTMNSSLTGATTAVSEGTFGARFGYISDKAPSSAASFISSSSFSSNTSQSATESILSSATITETAAGVIYKVDEPFSGCQYYGFQDPSAGFNNNNNNNINNTTTTTPNNIPNNNNKGSNKNCPYHQNQQIPNFSNSRTGSSSSSSFSYHSGRTAMNGNRSLCLCPDPHFGGGYDDDANREYMEKEYIRKKSEFAKILAQVYEEIFA